MDGRAMSNLSWHLMHTVSWRTQQQTSGKQIIDMKVPAFIPSALSYSNDKRKKTRRQLQCFVHLYSLSCWHTINTFQPRKWKRRRTSGTLIHDIHPSDKVARKQQSGVAGWWPGGGAGCRWVGEWLGPWTQWVDPGRRLGTMTHRLLVVVV